MCRRITIFLFALVLSPSVFSQTAAAQDHQIEESPLKVTAQFSASPDADCTSGQNVVLQMHYMGTQPLRGYLVRLALTGSVTGKVLQERSIQDIRDSRETMITSGAEWTRTFCSTPKKIPGDSATLTATVDVLKFADNSIWGPAALRGSQQLIGTLDGMDFIEKTTELKKFVSPIQPQQGPLPAGDMESQTIGPLKFDSGVWHDDRRQDMLAVEVTNESTKPIRGYLFTTTFLDPNTGMRIRRVSTKELETQGNPSEYLAPGSAWVADPRKFSHLPDGTLAGYKITLDLVVFADGSIFGPIESRESDEVLGMFRGIDATNGVSQEALAAKER
jgi:hypothetical protein